jgi:ClpP class serine protease
MNWLLEAGVLALMQSAEYISFVPTAEQRTNLLALARGPSAGGSPLLTVAGDQAEIFIEGVLTPRRDFGALFFGPGNTIYGEIISAIAEADMNEDVKQITLNINSPGGNIEGLFETLAAMEKAKTPIKAVVSGVAASAAYAIAAQADTIEATSKAAMFGSIGIVTTVATSDRSVTIASTNAPKKAPDAKTEEGVEIIREQLDGVAELFVEAIAKGRDVSEATVNKKFGQGGVLLAAEALERGMIDTLSAPVAAKEPLTAPKAIINKETKAMNLAQLKAEHPALYAEVLALGVVDGVAAERDRVEAHAKMGAAYGAEAIALKAIAEGTPMTASLTADYMTAKVNAEALAANAGNDPATEALGTPAKEEGNEERDATANAALLAASAKAAGVELEA